MTTLSHVAVAFAARIIPKWPNFSGWYIIANIMQMWWCLFINIYIYLVGGLEHDFFWLSIYWDSSSQLTNIFQRGWNHQPDIYIYNYTYNTQEYFMFWVCLKVWKQPLSHPELIIRFKSSVSQMAIWVTYPIFKHTLCIYFVSDTGSCRYACWCITLFWKHMLDCYIGTFRC